MRYLFLSVRRASLINSLTENCAPAFGGDEHASHIIDRARSLRAAVLDCALN